MQVPLPPPKWGFSADVGGQTLSFGPYDSDSRARQKQVELSQFVPCSEVMPLHTCGSADQLIKAFRDGWRPDRQPVRGYQESEPVEYGSGMMISDDRPQRVELVRGRREVEPVTRKIMRALGRG